MSSTKFSTTGSSQLQLQSSKSSSVTGIMRTLASFTRLIEVELILMSSGQGTEACMHRGKNIYERREPRGVGWDDDHEKVDPRFWPNEQMNWTEEEEKSARSKLRKTGLGRQVRCDSRFKGKYLHRK